MVSSVVSNTDDFLDAWRDFALLNKASSLTLGGNKDVEVSLANARRNCLKCAPNNYESVGGRTYKVSDSNPKGGYDRVLC